MRSPTSAASVVRQQQQDPTTTATSEPISQGGQQRNVNRSTDDVFYSDLAEDMQKLLPHQFTNYYIFQGTSQL